MRILRPKQKPDYGHSGPIREMSTIFDARVAAIPSPAPLNFLLQALRLRPDGAQYGLLLGVLLLAVSPTQ